jgi:hypothetical protein
MPQLICVALQELCTQRSPLDPEPARLPAIPDGTHIVALRWRAFFAARLPQSSSSHVLLLMRRGRIALSFSANEALIIFIAPADITC